MKKLTVKQKNRFAEKIMEWGNSVFVGAVLAQLFAKEYNVIIFLFGVILWLASFILGTSIK